MLHSALIKCVPHVRFGEALCVTHRLPRCIKGVSVRPLVIILRNYEICYENLHELN